MLKPAPVRFEFSAAESALCWSRLSAALLAELLPGEGGRPIRCVPDDFMLMHIGGNGDVSFKNIVTRNYLVLTPSGRLVVPTGEAFARGVFAHG